jgi:hypothetical protein
MLRVDRYASDGTDLHALGLVKMARALGAFGRINFIDLQAQINGLVGALWLTHIAVDAFIGDHQCHVRISTKFALGFMDQLSGNDKKHPHRKAVGAAPNSTLATGSANSGPKMYL